MKFSVIAAFIAAFTMSALAHEGHDHGAPPPPVSVSSAPRAQALSDSLELVAIARDGKLSIYVDDFATNEPASDLVIEVRNTGTLASQPVASSGVGLEILQRRLDLHYPDRHRLSLSEAEGMVCARLELEGEPCSA